MTFPENMDLSSEEIIRIPQTAGEALKAILHKAVMEGRVTNGAFECAQLLQEMDPECMNMCILPVSPIQEDITIRIQHTLIQAFCWENDIQLIKVDTMQKLTKILTANEMEANINDDNNNMLPLDYSCVLVKCDESLADDNLEMDSNYLKLLNNEDIIVLPE